jgi:predicted AlkP superfamily pyrophosphatase or phosphodiesterase
MKAKGRKLNSCLLNLKLYLLLTFYNILLPCFTFTNPILTMRKLLSSFSFFLLLTLPTFAQKPHPKLIVGVVVDQMRYDYLYKYWDKYSEGGFKKLVNEGALFKNAHYNYIPTFTAPGHCSIYTGTFPSVHGVAGNEWVDRDSKKAVYCTIDTADGTIKPVGTNDNRVGCHSPRRQMVTTLGDELRIFTNFQSKVVGVALKDRSSILPAGHNANGAYWLDGSSGNFVTSSFFKNELPLWVANFNNLKLVESFLSKPWNTLLPIEKYTESFADNNRYEGSFANETAPVFPHNLPEIRKKTGLGLIRETPFGNTLTKEMALAAINGEELGKDDITDLLAISFSSPDYIGHHFGPQSIEVEDCYLRLDLELAELITYLEKNIGKDNFLLFLSADHGAAQNANYLKDQKIPAGYYDGKVVEDSLKAMLNRRYGQGDWLLSFTNEQVYLNRPLIANRRMNPEEVENNVARYLETLPHVHKALPAHTLRSGAATSKMERLAQNGLHPTRSGDVMVIMEFGFMDYSETGTTHGTAFSYDTQIPLLFYGKGIKPGHYYQAADITDIAPTVSTIANIPLPGGATGKALEIK